MALAYPNTSGTEMYEEIAKNHYIAALGDRTLELKIREREPADLDAAYTISVRLEAYAGAYNDEDERDGRIQRQRRGDDGLAKRVAAIEKSVRAAQTETNAVTVTRPVTKADDSETVASLRQ